MAAMWEEETVKTLKHWSNPTKTQLKHVSLQSTVRVGPPSTFKRPLPNGD